VLGNDAGCGQLSDGVIEDNVFEGNAIGNATYSVSHDYQVNIDNAPGWTFIGNKLSGGTTGGECGELYMGSAFGVSSGVITNNRFDISKDALDSSCPLYSTSNIESIVLTITDVKGLTFSGNNIHNTTTTSTSGWDALYLENNSPSCVSQLTAGNNVFAQATGFTLNAINYGGSCASSVPLLAVGNAYNANVTAPLSRLITTGTEQYLTMNATGTQTANTTRYLPITGLTSTFSTTVSGVAQSWGQTGTLAADGVCGQVGTASGYGQTYTVTLYVNGNPTTPAVTCTFVNTNTVGLGSGSAGISHGQTVEWHATQSTGSVAANPTLNLTFATQ
jgi:hypothetical protein